MNKNSLYIGATVLVLVGALAVADHYLSRSYVVNPPLVAEPNAVLLKDQKPGDDTIITYAKLAKPGYVAVYSAPQGGQKELIGTSDLLPAGEHRNVRVHHHHAVQSGATVTAAIVADDGDGVFEDTDATVTTPADADDSATATISDDADFDTSPTDQELSEELEDAGYETDAPSDDSAAIDSPEDGGDTASTTEPETAPETESTTTAETDGTDE